MLSCGAMKRQFVKTTLQIIFGVVLLWGLFAVGLAISIHQFGQIDDAQPADVIIILGPPLDRRVEQAVALWQRGSADYLLCTGGREAWEATTQAADCIEALTARGVPLDAILSEAVSLSTEENALYSLPLLNSRGWQSVILVSDANHLLRSRWLFERMGVTVYTSPAIDDRDPIPYMVAVLREVIAFHWQVIKDALRLPFTRVTGI